MQYNKIVLMGRLTKDPEVINDIGKKGSKVVNFKLAVNRGYKRDDGADFFSCKAWNKLAEIVEKIAVKGSLVLIDGEMHMRRYEDKSGQTRVIYDVNVRNFQVLDKRKSNNSENNETNNYEGIDDIDDIDVEEDDLPF